jgi:hypothetical protein
MRFVFLPVAAVLAACVAPAERAGALDRSVAYEAWLESYCRGGIAGIFNRVLADIHGDIHATRHPMDDPVPVVAREPDIVSGWFATAETAARTRVEAPGYAEYPYPDAIVCGVILHAEDGTYSVDAPALQEEMMKYLPAPG